MKAKREREGEREKKGLFKKTASTATITLLPPLTFLDGLETPSLYY